MSLLKRIRDLGWDARFNVRDDVPELKCPGPDWLVARDRELYTLFARFQASKLFPAIQSAGALWKSLYGLLREDETLHYDPLKEWLESLSAWDGSRRLGRLLETLYGADDDAAQSASHFLCVGPVARAYQPGTDIYQLPVLISWTIWHTFSDLISELPPHVVSSNNSLVKARESDKHELGSIFRSALLQSPVRDMTDSKSEKLRNFLFRSVDIVKMPYKPLQPYPRRAAFVLTGSDEKVPRGVNGIAAYVPIRAVYDDGSQTNAYINESRDQLWAEALAIYRSGDHNNACPGYFERR